MRDHAGSMGALTHDHPNHNLGLGYIYAYIKIRRSTVVDRKITVECVSSFNSHLSKKWFRIGDNCLAAQEIDVPVIVGAFHAITSDPMIGLITL